MKAKFEKYWPSLVTLAMGTVLFLNDSVQSYALSHPKYGVIIGTAWGIALHWAQSPKATPGSKF